MTYKLFYCLLIYVLYNHYCFADNHDQLYSKIERYENFDEKSSEESPDNWHKANQSTECKNWFQSVMDFFFGEADEERGQQGGIFTRMVNWIRKGMCRMNGTCGDDRPLPSPDFPMYPPNFPDDLPPSEPEPEPEAEVVPETDEKKETNDVQ